MSGTACQGRPSVVRARASLQRPATVLLSIAQLPQSERGERTRECEVRSQVQEEPRCSPTCMSSEQMASTSPSRSVNTSGISTQTRTRDSSRSTAPLVKISSYSAQAAADGLAVLVERRTMDHHELAPNPSRRTSFSVMPDPLQSDRQSVSQKARVGDELRLDQELHLRTRALRWEGQLQHGRGLLEPTDHAECCQASSKRARRLVRRVESGNCPAEEAGGCDVTASC